MAFNLDDIPDLRDAEDIHKFSTEIKTQAPVNNSGANAIKIKGRDEDDSASSFASEVGEDCDLSHILRAIFIKSFGDTNRADLATRLAASGPLSEVKANLTSMLQILGKVPNNTKFDATKFDEEKLDNLVLCPMDMLVHSLSRRTVGGVKFVLPFRLCTDLLRIFSNDISAINCSSGYIGVTLAGQTRQLRIPDAEHVTDESVTEILDTLRSTVGVTLQSCPIIFQRFAELACTYMNIRVMEGRLVVSAREGDAAFKATLETLKLAHKGSVVPQILTVFDRMVSLADAISLPKNFDGSTNVVRVLSWKLNELSKRDSSILTKCHSTVAALQRNNMALTSSAILLDVDALLKNFGMTSRVLMDPLADDNKSAFKTMLDNCFPYNVVLDLCQHRGIRSFAPRDDITTELTTSCGFRMPDLEVLGKTMTVVNYLKKSRNMSQVPDGSVMIGVDRGHDAKFMADNGFKLVDLNGGKTVHGIPVGYADARDQLQLQSLFRPGSCVYSDVAVAGSGDGRDVKDCSWERNRLAFGNIVRACIQNDVRYIALKYFLPPVPKGANLPPEVVLALKHYDCDVIKPGKTHNDELFLCGVLRSKELRESLAVEKQAIGRHWSSLFVHGARIRFSNTWVLANLVVGGKLKDPLITSTMVTQFCDNVNQYIGTLGYVKRAAPVSLAPIEVGPYTGFDPSFLDVDINVVDVVPGSRK